MRKNIALLLLSFVAAPVFAQQVDQEIEAGPDSNGVMQSQMIIAADDGSGAGPAVTMFSSDGMVGDMVFASPGMSFGNRAPDIFALAQNSSVQKEIELVGEQMDQLKEINKEYSERVQEQMKSLHKDNGQLDLEAAKGLGELMKKLNEEKTAKMQEVFLPHQFDRLNQIAFQTQMRRSGNSSLLENQKVIDALEISDEQQKELKKRSREIKEELEEKIKELKSEAREELFEELSSKQRKKLKEMLGDDFEMKSVNMEERIRKIRERRRDK